MQLRYRALSLAASALVAMSASAQNATTGPSAPGQANPATQGGADQNAAAQTLPASDTGVTGGTSAGTAADTRKNATEEIVVTGSRVRRKDLTTPAPVTVINREQITSSGIASIGDFLQQMPEQGGALNTNVNNGGDGETAISLRNLGASRTLVLVDGKRWVAGGSGAGSFVDLNSIPTSAIERVEVLKDGASAVYGSDAISGVVNIITRRRVNGAELSAYGGLSPHGDAQQYDVSVTGGAAGDKGSFMFNGEYFNQQPMFAGNRSWAATPLALNYKTGKVSPGGSPTIPQGRATINLNKCNGNALCNAIRTTFGPAIAATAGSGCRSLTTGNCNISVMPDSSSPLCGTSGTPGVFAGDLASSGQNLQSCHVSATINGVVQNWRPSIVTSPLQGGNNTNDLYNFQAVNYLITPSQRFSLFSNGDFHLTNSARAYFQGSFLNRKSSTQLASEPLSTAAFSAQLPPDNAFNPFGAPANFAGPVATPTGPGGSLVPTPGAGQFVTAARRLNDAGPRSSSFDLSTYRAVIGLDGTLPEEFGPLQGVFWDVSFNYGRTEGTTTFGGSVNTLSTTNAIGSTDPAGTTCLQGQGGAAIDGCTPANLFAPQGGINAAQLSSLGFYTGVNSGFTQLASTQANISAELFKLAADRPVGLAAGYEYRAEFGGFTPDPIGAAGLSFDFNSLPTRGSYHVNEGYAELDIPLLSNIPGAEDLEIEGAVRVFDYSTFGSDYTYKLGGRWRPVRDVTFRGTYSTGFRAPGISDLFGGQAPSAEPATDPCASADPGSALGQRCNSVAARQGAAGAAVAGNGDPSTQINSTVGGNPALQPEKANVGTVGLVFEPTMFRGFSATLDYYNIKVTQNLGNITTPVILAGCYNTQAPNEAYCNLIQRDPASGFISVVSDLENNVGSVQTSGLDFAVRYGFPTEFGRFGLLFDSTYLFYLRQSLADGSVINTAGNYDFGSGSAVGSLTPKLKFNVGVNYALAGFGAGIRMRYIGPYNECAGGDDTSNSAGLCSQRANTDAAHRVPTYTSFDLALSYLFKTSFGNTTIAGGIRNLFDNNPPYVYNETFIFTDPGYDLVGRFLYGRITQTF
jgi:iron complex outermembrane receptor protein